MKKKMGKNDSVKSSDKPLIWCGDLNVSHEDIDMSNPDFFSTAKYGYVPPNQEILREKNEIDYFIVSEKLKERIVACEMHGKGIELDGFYGSEHCPVSLELSPASADQA